jgi:putative membrane protein insertion efficiency factor
MKPWQVRMQSVWLRISNLPSRLLIMLVRLYQVTLSPFIGRNCRFQPTCSHYMIGAVEKYGFWRGSWLGIYRILRCNPFCKGGYDPP